MNRKCRSKNIHSATRLTAVLRTSLAPDGRFTKLRTYVVDAWHQNQARAPQASSFKLQISPASHVWSACAKMRQLARRGFRRLSNHPRQWTTFNQEASPLPGRRRIAIQATPSTDSSTIVLDNKPTSVSSPGNTASEVLAMSHVLMSYPQTLHSKSSARHPPSSPYPSRPPKISTPAAVPLSASPPPPATLPAQSPRSAFSLRSAASSSASPSSTKRSPPQPRSQPSSPPNHH